jgi:steroid 5-alpha reductase family enzyme
MVEKKLIKAYLFVFFAYCLALCVTIWVGIITSPFHPLLITLFADLAATLVIFLISSIIKNTSLYDPYWNTAPLVIGLYFLLSPRGPKNDNIRYIIVLILVIIYSIRLTYNWLRGWGGLKHEDWRYMYYRSKMGKNFWLINLSGLQLMPTILVYLASISLYPAISLRKNSFNFLDIVAILITIGSILLETIADQQMHNFIKKRENSYQIINQGLWKYSRHPNYLGEILFWWGLFLFALASDLSFYWVVIGPILMTILFIFLSIPLIEKQKLEKRPDFASYKRRVPMLIPWFPKNKGQEK